MLVIRSVFSTDALHAGGVVFQSRVRVLVVASVAD